jgi:CelD/BcsL family acetyltransferase involved in cellulose biosynthesis
MRPITEISTRPGFMALEKEWNALAAASRDSVNERHEFLRIFLDSFYAHWRGLRLLVARADDGALKGVLPLISTRRLLYGLPVNQLATPASVQFTRFDFPQASTEASGAFLDYLAQDLHWDVLQLRFASEASNVEVLTDLANYQGFAVAAHASLYSPYITLPKTYDELSGRLSAKFRANLRRRRANLAERGAIELEKFSGDRDLTEILADGFAIEQSGWKGQEGTAIVRDPAAYNFFTDLAEEAAQRGYLTLYFLKVGGKRVAFHFGLTYNGRYLFLKPGYDEAYKEFSPGHLIVEDVLKDCIAQGLEEFDFLGENMPWKEDWTSETRPHNVFYIFKNSPYGRLLSNIKSKGVPLIKKVLRAA